MSVLLLHDTKAYWFITRASGLTTFVLLTVVLVLGILGPLRWSSRRWPRFASQSLHANAALLATVLLGVHIVTTMADGYAPIRWREVVIPFVSAYRPLWLGLGALTFDVLIAIMITSALRRRIGQRAWRAVHATAYACWPVSLLHFLGTGSDAKVPVVFGLACACTAAVVMATGYRVVHAARPWTSPQVMAGLATVMVPALILAWALNGPLQPGWAKRAGTPVALLGHAPVRPSLPPMSAPVAARVVSAVLAVPFSAHLSGTERRTAVPGKQTRLDLAMQLSHGAAGSLLVALQGPTTSGGTHWVEGGALLGPQSQPGRYAGTVVSYDGQRLVMQVADRTGLTLDLLATIHHRSGNRVDGTVTASRHANPVPPPAAVVAATAQGPRVQPIRTRPPATVQAGAPAATSSPAAPPPAPAATPSPRPSPTSNDDGGNDDHGGGLDH